MEKFLPSEIILDILSRLPAQSVIQCRRVCKTWRSLLIDTHFADMHLHRQLLQLDHSNIHCSSGSDGGSKMHLGLLFLVWRNKRVGYQLYYGEYDENVDMTPLTKINHPSTKKRHKTNAMVSSCNGLACFSTPHPRCGVYDPTYVFNPVTREYVNLPKLNFSDEFVEKLIVQMVSGFGYHPSTNEYKVIRIFYPFHQPTIGQVQVYTLGSDNGWRNKGEITYSLGNQDNGQQRPGVLVNGTLHWLDKKNLNIVAFDLADEVFHVLPSPPCFRSRYEYKHCFKLQELGGSLCFVHQERGERIDIWSYQKKKKNSSSYNRKDQEYPSWSRGFSIAIREGRYHDEYDTFALTKRAEVLMWYNRTILCCYDSKTATLRKLVDHDTGLIFFEAIPHMNSLISLKALGERRSRKRKQTYMQR